MQVVGKTVFIQLVVLLFAVIRTVSVQAQPTAPTGLMVEYIRSPEDTVIRDATPEYSWILSQEVTRQSAYQILVATSQLKIDADTGDVWDSGRVESTQSVSVSHVGKPLAANMTYFWKVRAWNQDDLATPYSPPQEFHTGSFDDGITSGNSLQTTWAEPQRFDNLGNGTYLIDFGKAAFGTVEFDYKVSETELLTLRLGEKLNREGRVDRNPGGTIRFQELDIIVDPDQKTYRVSLPRDERNTSGAAIRLPESLGVVIPFRYCEIEGASVPVAAQDIRQMRVHTYWNDDAASFSSSDETLDQIWELCKYSIKATTFAGLYVDGDRERIPYEADAYINQLGHYAMDREYTMAKQTLEYFMHHPTWPTEWLLHTALMAYQDYMYTGDTDLVRAYYDLLTNKTLIALAREDGLISSKSDKVNGAYMRSLGFPPGAQPINDIVDWPPAQKDTGWRLATPEGERDGYDMVPINTVVNCFFYENMVVMSKLARAIGKEEDAAHFDTMAKKVKIAINTKLFDTQRGIYLDGEGSNHASLHANMIALAFKLVPDEHVGSVSAFVKSRGMACSVYGAQYLLQGLYNAGEAQYALDLMRSREERSWWNMIRVGSTITLEAWDMKYKPNLDWNHVWGAAPANIVSRGLWGIVPLEPGFSTLSITPQFGDIQQTSLTTPTIRGPISAQYLRSEEGEETYKITLPGNTKGMLCLPLLEDKILIVNGTPIQDDSNPVTLGAGINQITISTPK